MRDHLPGFLQDRHDLVEAEGLALGDRRDHAARRSRADAACQQSLDECDQVRIRLRAVADRAAALVGIVAEGTGGPLRADEALQQGIEFIDRRRARPDARLAERTAKNVDEGDGLDTLDRVLAGNSDTRT